MAKIELTPSELMAQSAEMDTLSQEYTSFFNGTTTLLNTMNSNWSANLSNNFAGKITTAGKSFTALSTSLSQGAEAANKSAASFESIDTTLSKTITTGQTSGNSSSGVTGSSEESSSIWEPLGYNYTKTEREGFYGKATESGSITGIEEDGSYIRVGNFKEESERTLTSNGKKKEKITDRPWGNSENEGAEYFDKEGNSYTEKEANYYKQDVAILEHKAEKSVSVSALEFGTSEENEFGNYSSNVTVLNAEAHASASGGLYVMSADGKKILAPSANVEVGASVTALSATADAQLGNDMLGVTGKVTATAGKVSGKGSVTASLVDENGYPCVQLEAEAKVEAIAAEVSGTVEANILGGGVSATGSVNFGIGAHAEVGIKNGVIKCDVGASLGLGVSVSFEVDIGGMAQTLATNGKEALETAGKTVKAVADVAGSALKKLKFW